MLKLRSFLFSLAIVGSLSISGAHSAETIEIGAQPLPSDNELKQRLQDHLEFIQERLPNNPEKYFEGAQEVNRAEKVKLGQTLGEESEGVVFRKGEVDTATKFELNYRVKINTEEDYGHVGPFSYQKLRQKEVSAEQKVAQNESIKSDQDKEFTNITLELGAVYIDLYEIEGLDYLIGNVYLRNDDGVLEYFGQTVIQRVKG